MSHLPRTVGPLTLLRKLETDPVSEVFEGTLDTRGGRSVLVRRILPHILRDETRLRAIESRAKELMQVEHELLQRTFHWVVEGSDRYLVEELAQGVGLDTLITWCRVGDRTLPPNVYLTIAAQICNALDALHANRSPEGGPLLHMGLTPSSLTLKRGGKVVVGMFALSRSPTSVPVEVPSATLTYRSQYLSPEQTHPDRPLEPSSDLFSLGTILYELLMLEPLFTGDNSVQAIHQIRKGEVTRQLLDVKERLPGLDKVLYRTLSVNPRSRYQRAFVLREDLRALMANYSFQDITETVNTFLEPMIGGLDSLDEPSATAPFRPASDEAAPNGVDPSDEEDEAAHDESLITWTSISGVPSPLTENRARETGARETGARETGGRETGGSEPTIIRARSRSEGRLRPEERAGDPAGYSMELKKAAQERDDDSDLGEDGPVFSRDPSEDSYPRPQTDERDREPSTREIVEHGDGDRPTDYHTAAPSEPAAGELTVPSASVVDNEPWPGQPRFSEDESHTSPPVAPWHDAAEGGPGDDGPPTRFYRIPDDRSSAPPSAPPPAPATPPSPKSPVSPMRAVAPAPPSGEPPPLWPDEPSAASNQRSSQAALWLAIGLCAAVVLVLCAGLGFQSVRIVAQTIQDRKVGEHGEVVVAAAELPADPADLGAATDPTTEPADAPPVPDAVASAPASTPEPSSRPLRADPPRPILDRPTSTPAEPAAAEPRTATHSASRQPVASRDAHDTPSDDELFADLSEPEPTEPEASEDGLASAADVIEPGGLDYGAMKSLARKGDLTSSEVMMLEMVETSEPSYTRSRAILLMNAQKQKDPKSTKRYLDDLMRLPENQYDPVFLTELARYYVTVGKYQQAVDKARTAEQYWARLPSELVFTKKAEMYEIQARGYTGMFFASESVESLEQAIRAWEKYKTHVATKSQSELGALAQGELDKLLTYRDRME